MKLLIDIGNTCLHWVYADEESMCDRGVIVHRSMLPPEAVAIWQSGDRPTSVFMASVGGQQLTDAIRQWIDSHWRVPVEVITATERFGRVYNGYKSAAQLGVDRWLAMIAAFQHYGGPACIVDCGTAMTADILSVQGRHLGGLIMPGLSMMRRALSENTSAIEEYQSSAPQQQEWLADNSRDAVLAGTHYMQLAVINQFVSDARLLLNSMPTCIITGGAAAAIRPGLDNDWQHDPDLVFQGMRIVAGSLA